MVSLQVDEQTAKLIEFRAQTKNLSVADYLRSLTAKATQLDDQVEKAGECLLPVVGTYTERRQRFHELAKRWREETKWLSSSTEIAMHPAYQAIIGMGREALPWILEDLRDSSGHWFWALKAISNEDPVPPGDRGAIKKMQAEWLAWGAAKGLLAL